MPMIAMISEAATMSKPVSRGNPMGGAAKAGNDVSQVAVVHVDRSPPGHAVRRDLALVAVEDVAVDERGEHVVGGRDRRGSRR